MPGGSDNEIRYVAQNLHPDRKLVIPMDEFRGGDFVVGTIISGAALSNGRGLLSGGGNVASVTTSSVIRIRPLNLELYNGEPGWVTVEFMDGSYVGGAVLGPYKVLPESRLPVPREDLVGRYFTSSIFAVVSGWTPQCLTSGHGVKVKMGYVKEPLDFYE